MAREKGAGEKQPVRLQVQSFFCLVAMVLWIEKSGDHAPMLSRPETSETGGKGQDKHG